MKAFNHLTASAFKLFIALVVVLFGFNQTGHAKTKIGFILSTMQEERYQRDKEIFIKTVEK